MKKYSFTWENIEKEYLECLKNEYQIITCEEYVKQKGNLTQKTIVNRIDIDFSVKKVDILLDIFDKLNIKGTFFVRLHAPEYNPFSFEGYRVLKRLLNSGHELGYHSEIVDQSIIWNENAEDCLIRDIEVLGKMFNYKVNSVASHGGNTGFNNLDFWKDKKPSDYNLLYEGYDKEPKYNLFQEAFYISDSEWTQWKCYNKGKLVENDRRSPSEHLEDNHQLIHLLIHPDTYFNNHFYE
tara:strand:+ start:17806 stop:18519 length:714 start_codon:yes stop_codon:yes gene_type:complete